MRYLTYKGDQNSVGDAVDDRETFLALRQLLASLSPRQAEVIQLKFFGSFRNREIAETLDLDERTVSAYLARGLKTLGERYEESFRDEIEEIQDE